MWHLPTFPLDKFDYKYALCDISLLPPPVENQKGNTCICTIFRSASFLVYVSVFLLRTSLYIREMKLLGMFV